MPHSDRLDRRSFLTVLGLSGAVGMAGCSSGSDGSDGSDGTDGSSGSDGSDGTDGSSGSDGSDGTDGGSMSGNILRVSHFEGPTTINPILNVSGGSYMACQWMYSNLTVNPPAPDGEGIETRGDLATDWSANDAADQWVFTLREDATWHHDGNKVIAEDVKATIETIYQEDQDYPGLGALGPIDTVDVINDFEVQINLSSPDAEIPEKMGLMFGRILPKNILDQEGVRAFDTEDYGSGPFVLENFEKGNVLEVSAYDDYYLQDEDGNSLPHLDGIEFLTQPEPTGAVTSLENQNTDIMQSLPASQYARVENNSDLEALQTPGGRHFPVIMMPIYEPMDKKGVRDAVKYAVDKEDMLQGAVDGLGVTAENHPISPAYELYEELDDKFGVESQPEKARQALADAGYPDGLDYSAEYGTVKTPAQYQPPAGDTAVLLKEHLAEIDFNIEVQEVSWDQFLSGPLGNEPMYVNTYGMRPTAAAMMHLIGHSEGGFNHGHFHPDVQPEFDEVIEKAITTVDIEQRKQHVVEAMEMFQDHGGMIIPFFSAATGAQANYVEDYQLDPTTLAMFLEDVRLGEGAPDRS